MRDYSELSPLEKKAREANELTYCVKCPIYGLCRRNETIIDACDYIFLNAFKAGYNTHKKEVKNKNKIRK